MTILSVAIGSVLSNIIYDIDYRLNTINFALKNKIKESCLFVSRRMIRSDTDDNFQHSYNDIYFIYFKKHNDIGCCIITDTQIKTTLITSKLSQVLNNSSAELSQLNTIPEKDFSVNLESIKQIKIANDCKLDIIQNDLEYTKETMKQNIEDIISRGESLDSLIDQSNDLSRTSKMFYKSTKQMNPGCCIIC